jgi:hypothetical protein
MKRRGQLRGRGQKKSEGGFTPPAKYHEPERGNKTKRASARNKRLEKAAL